MESTKEKKVVAILVKQNFIIEAVDMGLFCIGLSIFSTFYLYWTPGTEARL